MEESVSRNKLRHFRCMEGPVIMPEHTLLEAAHQNKWKNTLIGKIHVTENLKCVEPCHLFRDINRAWNDISIFKFTITEFCNGMFGFQFEDERDMKRVMDSRPWLVTEDHYFYIHQYLLVLTEWCPNTPPPKIKFSDSQPFWIQVRNIPYEYVSREMGKKIGEGTGHVVLDVDLDGTTTNSRIIKCLRIRVLVNLKKKLAPGCWLHIDDRNQPKRVLWVPFKYEKLPLFCYACGIIGHPDDSCWDDEEDVEEDDAINYNPLGDESELPEVLVEGQVLRFEGYKGYGHWLYEQGTGTYEWDDVDGENDDKDEDYDEDDEESENSDEDYEGLVEDEETKFTDEDPADIEIATVNDESDDQEMETEEDEDGPIIFKRNRVGSRVLSN